MTLKNKICPAERRKLLKNLLKKQKYVRILEAHNGISALVANDSFIKENGEKVEFHGMWESSLTDSASKGYPDAEIIGFDSRMANIRQILNVTNKPIIVDGDTGGEASNFEYMVKTLEMNGVSAVIIEDKVFPKRNSLEGGTIQTLEDPKIFANKIKRGKEILMGNDFMIIARLESLIAGWGQEDALRRAKEYMLAGVDAIMIHSKQKTPDEILKFAENYDKLCKELGFRKPLVCVPTTYNIITENELADKGFNIIIHANHLLRASHKAMEEVSKVILSNRRSFEADPLCSPVKEIFQKVGFLDIKEKDKEKIKKETDVKVIIPAAGEEKEMKDILGDKPRAMLEINGNSLLQRQIDTLQRCNINDVSVVVGYGKDKFNVENVKYFDNLNFKNNFDLASLFCAEKEINGNFVLINSDILFNENIIKNLIDTKQDIVIVVDNSYEYHKHLIDKELELVVTKESPSKHYRNISLSFENRVLRIGKKISSNLAHYEFIGIVYFSEQGAENLKKVYLDIKKSHKGRFHEAETMEKASITDLLQEMIDRGFAVHFIETNKGWIEIHNKKDLEIAKKMVF